MRILFISNDYPSPLQSTKAVFNRALVTALSREHQVSVVNPIAWTDELRARRRSPALSADGGVDVHYPRYYFTPRLFRGQYGRFFWWSIRPTVRRLLREQTPDVVLAYWAHPDGEAAVRAARIAGCPAVVMVGGSDVLLLTRDAARRRCIVRALEAADAVVTTSRDLQQAVIRLGLPAEKVSVVYRGVDPEKFAPGDAAAARRRLGLSTNGRMVLWVGRMVPVKGLDVLIDAAALVRRQIGDFQLSLVGDGPLRAQLESRASATDVADCIRFVGAVAHDELPDWYRAADCTVLSSLNEGVPNVLRESLACGVPFVASDVGGIREIARNDACTLVPASDVAALADGIIRTLSVPRPAAAAAPAGWEESAEALLRIIRPLLGAARQPLAATAAVF